MLRLFSLEPSSDTDLLSRCVGTPFTPSNFGKAACDSPKEETVKQKEITKGAEMLQFSYDVSDYPGTYPLSMLSEEGYDEDVEPAWNIFD